MPDFQDLQMTSTVPVQIFDVIIAVGGAATVIAKMFSPFRQGQAKLKRHDELLDIGKRNLNDHEEAMKLVLRA